MVGNNASLLLRPLKGADVAGETQMELIDTRPGAFRRGRVKWDDVFWGELRMKLFFLRN